MARSQDDILKALAETIAAAKKSGNYLLVDLPGGPIQDGWIGTLSTFDVVHRQAVKIDLLLAAFGGWRTCGVVAVIDDRLVLPLAHAGDLITNEVFDHAEFGKFLARAEAHAAEIALRYRGLEKNSCTPVATIPDGSVVSEKILVGLAAITWDDNDGRIVLPDENGIANRPLRLPSLEELKPSLITGIQPTKAVKGVVVKLSVDFGLVELNSGLVLKVRTCDGIDRIRIGDAISCQTCKGSDKLSTVRTESLLAVQPPLEGQN